MTCLTRNRKFHDSIGAMMLALLPMIVLGTAASAQDLIGNFREIERTPDRLTIGVDYAYSGRFGTEHVFIYAIPLSRTEPFHPRLFRLQTPQLVPGTQSVSIVMERQPKSEGYVASDIKVCMIARAEGGDFQCAQFALAEPWGGAVSETRPKPPPGGGAPVITVFRSDESRIPEGDGVTLTWKAENADVVQLGTVDPRDPNAINGATSVKAAGSKLAVPRTSTTYVLQAFGAGKSERAEVAVTVVPPLDLITSATGNTAVCSLPFALTWESQGAAKVTFNGSPVGENGQRLIGRVPFRYEIVAFDDFGGSIAAAGTISREKPGVCQEF